jgi:uncharacterized membrane protein
MNRSHLTRGARPILDMKPRTAGWLLAAMILTSTLGFSALAYLKFASFNWETEDTTFVGYAFFQTLNGKFFPCYAREGSLFGSHPDFILTAWFPIFRLAPSMLSLFFFQSLMISLAAWPAYLLARSHTCDRLTALIAAAGLLFLPPVVGQHVNHIHDDQFGLAFLLFAMYFFEKEQFPKFGLFMVLATLAKETIALNAMMFGLYALIRRRQRQWIAGPLVWGVVYLVVMLKWLMPKWGPWGGVLYGQMLYFSQYGNTPAEVLKHFALHPVETLKTMLAPDRLKYLGLLLAPLLMILPFGSWAWLVAAPSLAINLLGTNDLLRHFFWHYSLIAGGVLWASFLIALPRWSRILERRFGTRNYARILCLIALVLSISFCHLWLRPWQYRPTAAHPARRQAIELVPVTATVLAPENMLAHFVRHPALHSLTELWFQRLDPNQLFDYDYIVFDANYTDWPAQSQLYALIAPHPDYQLVFSHDNVAVFKRVGTPPRTLRWSQPPGG